MTAGSVRFQGDEAKINIATGTGNLKTGCSARGIAAIAAIAGSECRAVELALAAIAAGGIGENGRIVQYGRGAVDIDRGGTAKGIAAITPVQPVAASAADAAGIDIIDRIAQIILIDVDGGIAAGAGAAIPRDVDSIAGKAEYVPATTTGSGRSDRELGEIQCTRIVVERGVAARRIAAGATDAGLHQSGEGAKCGRG